MQLESLGRRPKPLRSLEVLYTAASTIDWKKKISDSKWKNSMSSSGSNLPPLTRILEFGHFRPCLPARALRVASVLLAMLENCFEFRRNYLEVPSARSGVAVA